MLVKPKFTQTVALPQQIKIPVDIATVCGSPRVIVLRHGTDIPVAVAEFMLNDPRYRGWFAENPLAGVAEDPAAVVPAAVAEPAVVVPVAAEPVAVEPSDEVPLTIKKKGKL